VTGTKELRELAEKVGFFDSGEPKVCSELTNALKSMQDAIFTWEAIHWRHVNKKPSDHPVPFDLTDACERLTLDADGWVVPTVPVLESGKWYEHDLTLYASSPACFVDQETMVEVHTRTNGLEEKAYKLKDIANWNMVRMYRKFEPMDEVISGFGIF
jgi:hypothetical protein